MIKLKITSNPYKKEIRYQKWSNTNQQWKNIDHAYCGKSKLVSDEFSRGLFSFCVKDIIETIIEEYGTDEDIIQVVFEGSDDEFKELEYVCCNDEYKNLIFAVKSDYTLANPRELLSQIRDYFSKIESLAVQNLPFCEKLQNDINDFNSASNDTVPICVIGARCVGKSTFVNALIGKEILPSDTKLTTDRVYKIIRSKDIDKASVKCHYDGTPVVVEFHPSEVKLKTELTFSNPFIDAINKTLNNVEGCDISSRIYKILNAINDFENGTKNHHISELIQIETAFGKGLMAHSQCPFMLFDVSCPQFESNIDNIEKLLHTIGKFSGGLLIFLSTFDMLDNQYGEELSNAVYNANQFDNRFTMIVVNKADKLDLQKIAGNAVEEKRILNYVVPRNLYSSGLFYVSSLIALGAKTNGIFADKLCADIYSALVSKYSSESCANGKQVYSLNIMPEQFKERACRLAAAQSDFIYANSGLFSIESEIEHFASKYFYYNQCVQSWFALHKIIEKMSNELDSQRIMYEQKLQDYTYRMTAKKEKIATRIFELKSSINERDSMEAYEKHMSACLKSIEPFLSRYDIEDRIDKLIKDYKKQADYGGYMDNMKKSLTGIANRFIAKFDESSKKDSLAEKLRAVYDVAITNKEIAKALSEGADVLSDSYQAQHDEKQKINAIATDMIVQLVEADYITKMNDVNNKIFTESKEYWMRAAEKSYQLFVKAVFGSSGSLNDISHIICDTIHFSEITLSEIGADSVPAKEEARAYVQFNKVFWQFDSFVVYNKFLDLYNYRFIDGVKKIHNAITTAHKETGRELIEHILNDISENCSQYDTELEMLSQHISTIVNKIEELHNEQNMLACYNNRLSVMFNWQEI